MATSLLNGKWPLLYQVWQKGHFIAKWQMATSLSSMANGHFLIWQLANLFMADAHTVAQSLYIMVIATVIRVKIG